jgi:hypothetical protein
VNKGNRIKLDILDIDLEHSRDCAYDFIEIFDGERAADKSLGDIYSQ